MTSLIYSLYFPNPDCLSSEPAKLYPGRNADPSSTQHASVGPQTGSRFSSAWSLRHKAASIAADDLAGMTPLSFHQLTQESTSMTPPPTSASKNSSSSLTFMTTSLRPSIRPQAYQAAIVSAFSLFGPPTTPPTLTPPTMT